MIAFFNQPLSQKCDAKFVQKTQILLSLAHDITYERLWMVKETVYFDLENIKELFQTLCDLRLKQPNA